MKFFEIHEGVEDVAWYLRREYLFDSVWNYQRAKSLSGACCLPCWAGFLALNPFNLWVVVTLSIQIIRSTRFRLHLHSIPSSVPRKRFSAGLNPKNETILAFLVLLVTDSCCGTLPGGSFLGLIESKNESVLASCCLGWVLMVRYLSRLDAEQTLNNKNLILERIY
ncbi:Histone-binding protein MSI1 [Forsythia ovata]|uniref:Histone-binding protein MSI1 n=1 Tax=Forsythia ovata TaxID=205694 RepID=A0ABD1VIA3_9LAMI